MTSPLLHQHTPGETTTLPLADIVQDPSLQLRVRLDRGTVQRYADLLAEDPRSLPPVVVVALEGASATDEPCHLLADGFHRLAAAELAGLPDLAAITLSGTWHDALLYAAQANAAHGLPLTHRDKRRIVTALLQDDTCAAWSNRRLARHSGTTHPFVAAVRRELSDDGSGYHDADTATAPAAGAPPGEREGDDSEAAGEAVEAQQDHAAQGGEEDDAPPDDPIVLHDDERPDDGKLTIALHAAICERIQISVDLGETEDWTRAWQGDIDPVAVAMVIGLDSGTYLWSGVAGLDRSDLTRRLIMTLTDTILSELEDGNRPGGIPLPVIARCYGIDPMPYKE